MDDPGFDLIAPASTDNGWLAIDVEVQLPFQHQIGFVPVVGVGRLTDSARGRKLSNAVLPTGLLSGEAQGDGITKNVSNLGLLLKQTKHGGSSNASSASQLFSAQDVLLPTADGFFCAAVPTVRAASTFNILVMGGQRFQSPLPDQPQT